MTRGLVLGKFAPLHRGHQSLIEHSLETTDETVVLVYDSPQVTRVPLAVRAGWIRELYPAAHVIEGHGAPADEGRDPRVMRLQEDYLRRVLPVPITHFFCSEWYGDHVARALGARDVRVDEGRDRFPISGTAARRDAHACRPWLHPRVYRDLIRRVVLLGAESTGKSTLAVALARAWETVQVEEVGRQFWMQHKDEAGRLSPTQLVELARAHRAAEDEATGDARRLLVVDTDATTTRHYARWYHDGQVEPELAAMAEECAQRYHLAVLCGDDIDYVEDGTRAGEERRRKAQRAMRAELGESGRDWIEVSGGVEARVAQVTAAVKARGLWDWA